MLLSLGLEGFFLVCLNTLEKASFMCWSTVFNRKYLSSEKRTQDIEASKGYSHNSEVVIFTHHEPADTQTKLKAVPAAKHATAASSVSPLLAHFLAVLHLLCLTGLQQGSVCNHLNSRLHANPVRQFPTNPVKAFEVLLFPKIRKDLSTYFVLKNISVVSKVEGE